MSVFASLDGAPHRPDAPGLDGAWVDVAVDVITETGVRLVAKSDVDGDDEALLQPDEARQVAVLLLQAADDLEWRRGRVPGSRVGSV